MSGPETVTPVQPVQSEVANGTPPAGQKEVPTFAQTHGKFRGTRTNRFLVISLAVIVAVAIGAAAVPVVKAMFFSTDNDQGAAGSGESNSLPAELIQEERTAAEIRRAYPGLPDKDIDALRKRLGPKYSLRLTKDAAEGLEVAAETAYVPREPRPLPPRVGTIQYDNDRLFILQSRFQGELGVMTEVLEPTAVTTMRPLRYGDRFKQGDLLAIVWSPALGAQKAALVDAICALRLSTDQLKRYAKLYEDGAIPLAVYKAQERQVQGDSGAVLTAKRTLKVWRLTADEIKEVEDEANKIIDLKLVRNADYEKKWAEVYVTVPKIPSDPNFQVTLVEKNCNPHQMVDPTTIMFKLADLSRLTIWVQPPEEDLPLLQERLRQGRRMKWQIQFQADPPGTRPLELEAFLIAPSQDPNLHTPLIMGYLPNKDKRYIVGQFVTATLFVDPSPDTVEIPTNALNDVEGQMLVFVEKDAKKREYTLRRVAVEHRFEKVSTVRSKLTEQDKQLSEVEQAKGRRPLEPLLPGERVLTGGIVELNTALETLLAADRADKQQQDQKK